MNPRPADYKSAAIPLSHGGTESAIKPIVYIDFHNAVRTGDDTDTIISEKAMGAFITRLKR